MDNAGLQNTKGAVDPLPNSSTYRKDSTGICCALPLRESKAYDGVKTAILLRYSINEVTYRKRFSTAIRKNGETNHKLAMRLMDLQNKWLKTHTTVQGIKEAIGIEQFLNSLLMET